MKRDFLIVKLRSFIDADPMHQTFWCRTSGAKKKTLRVLHYRFLWAWKNACRHFLGFSLTGARQAVLVKRRLRFPTFRARHTTSRNSCENRGVAGVDVFLLSCVFFSGAQAFLVIFMSWRIFHGCGFRLTSSKFFFGKGTKVQLGFTSRFS